MELTEFLMARIAEDEREALEAISARLPVDKLDRSLSGYCENEYSPFVRVGCERVLAESEAKRRIVYEHFWLVNTFNGGPTCMSCWYENGEGPGMWPCPTIRALASIYVDHPDHQPEWATSTASTD